MKMAERIEMRAGLLALVCVAALQPSLALSAASAPPDERVNYTLLPGSQLADDCPICGRPTFLEPMRGAFQLRLLHENPLFSTYSIERITFTAGTPAGRSYKITGDGTYTIGGEVALRQETVLNLWIDDGVANRLCHFTNADYSPQRQWPMLKVTLDQTNGTWIQTYHLEIAAAPFRDLWFSTQNGFHAGIWQGPTNFVSAGGLVSWTGHVAKRNQHLTKRLGVMPPAPDLGLDALDVLPGGEIAFSIETDVFSETLGVLHEGDVLSDRGRVAWSFNDLVSSFNPEPPVNDPGLDALRVLGTNEVYFSVRTDFFSRKLGRTVRRGDLLSSQGRIVKSNGELIAAFRPADPSKDYGLRDVFVWPSGEIWFATEDGFHDAQFEGYGRGDLLSDHGYVVYRNLDLLAVFQPLEDLADFGLDAVHVFSDAVAPPQPAFLAGFSADRVTGSLTFQWPATNSIVQLETAGDVTGAWSPCGPITGEISYQDVGALTNRPQAFYRLRQW
ncbi:MAG: hypothetical protein HZA90_19300 [Verrucomicrobia bacterium]|nr:hypothetical protein [Verrucomicrobiota bacterium]